MYHRASVWEWDALEERITGQSVEGQAYLQKVSQAIGVKSNIFLERIIRPSAWGWAYFWNVSSQAIGLKWGRLAECITGQLAWSAAYLQNISQGNWPEVRYTYGMYHRAIGLKWGILTECITGRSTWTREYHLSWSKEYSREETPVSRYRYDTTHSRGRSHHSHRNRDCPEVACDLPEAETENNWQFVPFPVECVLWEHTLKLASIQASC